MVPRVLFGGLPYPPAGLFPGFARDYGKKEIACQLSSRFTLR
jgi:hypothetical protein